MNTEKERRSWLVTGCSSGLGRALAEAVLARGDCCAVTARRPETLASFAERCPGTALVLPLDVTSPESMDNAVRAALDRFGGLDVLVNNAGYCLRGAVEECSDAEVRRQFETNFFGTVGMIRRVLPAMRAARSGAIVNFSSIAALSTSEGSAFYGASKLAVEGMSDGLRREVGPLGIRVMVVEPGPFRTRFFEALDISAGDLADYRGTAGRRKVRLKDPADSGMTGWGDNDRAARVIIRAIEEKEPPFRLLLGSLAVRLAEKVFADRLEETARWSGLSAETDADA